jgi:hypothetical protein
MIVEVFKVYVKIREQGDEMMIGGDPRSTIGIKMEDGQGFWDYTEYDNVEDALKHDLPKIIERMLKKE